MRRSFIEVSRDGLWAAFCDTRGIRFRAAAEWDEERGAAVFRFRAENGDRLCVQDPTVLEARKVHRQFKHPNNITDADYEDVPRDKLSMEGKVG